MKDLETKAQALGAPLNTKKQGEISQCLDMLYGRVEKALCLMSELASCLEPVLRYPEDMPPPDKKEAVQTPQTPLAIRLDELANRLDRTVFICADVLTRLEV